MFRDELEAALEACAVVYFAYGLCEPHGPQNAIGLDILKAHAICCAAAREHGGIVAPPDFWHVHEYAGGVAWLAKAIGERRSWVSLFRPMRPLVTSRPATYSPGAHRPSPARLAYQRLRRLVVPAFSAAPTADAA